MGERRIQSMAKSFLVTLAIVISLSCSTSAAVISTTPSITPQTPQNLSTPNNNYCISDQSWVGSVTYAADCIHAVMYLYETEVRKRRTPKTDYEFLTPKLYARTRDTDSMQTPRKYTVGTCTVAIVMQNFFQDASQEESVPGIPKGWSASRDRASYWELWQAATQLEKICLLTSEKPGWASEGGRGAIGIFMWGTDSEENKRVPQGAEIPPLPSLSSSLALPWNGTGNDLAFSLA